MSVFKSKIFLFILLEFLVVDLFSCRDDIYNPKSSVGNKNDPVTQSYYDSYSFVIDADNLTHDLVEFTQLTDAENFLDFSINNYQSGYVDLFVSDSAANLLYYSSRFNRDNKEVYDTLLGFIPEKVFISFHNFSGNFKVALYGNY